MVISNLWPAVLALLLDQKWEGKGETGKRAALLERLSPGELCALAAREGSSITHCSDRSTAGESRERIISLASYPRGEILQSSWVF